MLPPPLPHYGNADWQVFNAIQDATLTRGFQTWLRPVGAQWAYIFAMAGGGGGGGGQSTAASARTGGGGGASGSAVVVLFPLFVAPDILYVRAGMGGTGGVAAGNGGTGVSS
jgi:hypothetical protein